MGEFDWSGDATWWAVTVVALSLSVYSFSVALGFAPYRRGPTGDACYLSGEPSRRRFLLLAVAAVLGVVAAGAVSAWDRWPAGLLCGLGVVEVCMAVYNKITKKIDGL